jgi:4'-phosphopantetheinyl transferase
MVRSSVTHAAGTPSRQATADETRPADARRGVDTRLSVSDPAGARPAGPLAPHAAPTTIAMLPGVGGGTGVDLWASSTQENLDLADAIGVLDGHERARADRFRFERDRVRFIQRHAFVRGVLASYLGVRPSEIAIHISPGGRPELDPASGISFSASSSGDLAVVGVTRGPCVGVDIERLREFDDALAVADGLFTKMEVALLRSLPRAALDQAFLRLWTRKESLVKALGGGLSIPLDRYDVTDQVADGIWRPRGPEGPLAFAISHFVGPSGYVGAVAVRRAAAVPRDAGSGVTC